MGLKPVILSMNLGMKLMEFHQRVGIQAEISTEGKYNRKLSLCGRGLWTHLLHYKNGIGEDSYKYNGAGNESIIIVSRNMRVRHEMLIILYRNSHHQEAQTNVKAWGSCGREINRKSRSRAEVNNGHVSSYIAGNQINLTIRQRRRPRYHGCAYSGGAAAIKWRR